MTPYAEQILKKNIGRLVTKAEKESLSAASTPEIAAPSGTLAVTTGSLARRVFIEIRAPGFYYNGTMTPEKVSAFLALACDCILAGHTERTKEDAPKPENIVHKPTRRTDTSIQK